MQGPVTLSNSTEDNLPQGCVQYFVPGKNIFIHTAINFFLNNCYIIVTAFSLQISFESLLNNEGSISSNVFYNHSVWWTDVQTNTFIGDKCSVNVILA